MIKTIFFCLTLISSSSTFALNKHGRLGLGMTNHLQNDLTAISIKIQKTRSMAIGSYLGLSADEDNTTYAIGGKLYSLVYEEPQLNFYTALDASLFTYVNASEDSSQGYQVHALFGSELHLQGIESIGFSFEFGFGLSRAGDTARFETLGHNILQSAVHFYL